MGRRSRGYKIRLQCIAKAKQAQMLKRRGLPYKKKEISGGGIQGFCRGLPTSSFHPPELERWETESCGEEEDCKVEVKEEREEDEESQDTTDYYQGDEDLVKQFPLTDTCHEQTQNHCLLCYCATTLKLKGLRESSGTVGGKKETKDLLDFLALFIFKKMLDVPEEKLLEFEKLLGRPRNWIYFCNRCQPLILQAFAVQREINKLEEQLQKCREKIIEGIRSSVGKGRKKKRKQSWASPPNTEVFGVTDQTRSFVVDGVWPMEPQSRMLTKPVVDSLEAITSVHKMFVHEPDPLSTEGNEEEKEVPVAMSTYETDSTDDENWPWSPGTSVIGDPLDPSTTIDSGPGTSETTFETYYFCGSCPQLMGMNSVAFSAHILFHFERPYKCRKCNTYFTGNELELENYPKTKRKGKKHKCSMNTLVKVEYKAWNIWKCNHCMEKFSTEDERTAHETEIHFDKQPPPVSCKCGTCSKEFINMDEWRFHRILEHPEIAKVSCFFCEETFMLKTTGGTCFQDTIAMENHVNEQHIERKKQRLTPCRICGTIAFGFGSALKAHIIKEHGVDKVEFTMSNSCPVCFMKFSTRPMLMEHLRIVHCGRTKEKFFCYFCAYQNTVRVSFQEHMFMKHGVVPEDGRPILKCTADQCSFQCTLKRTLDVHMMKEHNAERKYKCSICGKGFLHNNKRKVHERIHLNANTKPYQCEICGNSFAIKNYLYIHMRLSHQNRPFASTNKKRPSQKKKRTSKNSVAPAESPDQGINPCPTTFGSPQELVAQTTGELQSNEATGMHSNATSEAP